MRIGWKLKVKARGAVPEMQELKRPPCAEKTTAQPSLF